MLLMRIVLYANLIVSLASAIAALLAMREPSMLVQEKQAPSATTKFYVSMYAARSLPFGLLSGLLPFLSAGTVVSVVLLTAAFIQVTDAVIAGQRKFRGMLLGATVGAVVHALTGFLLLHH